MPSHFWQLVDSKCFVLLAPSGACENSDSKKNSLLPKAGLQIVEPARFRIVPGEERTPHPIGVPTLK